MEVGTTIQDLAVVIVAAATASVIFRFLKLPALLGYILSGIVVGPHLLPNPLVTNTETINELSELGVAFLMFYIGLEFDIKKLQRIMGPAFLALTLQTSVMIFLGVLSAPLIGWSSINGLFLGCLLAISSTMITVPTIKAMDAMKSNFAQVAIGILILEDIIAILVLVILSGVAVTGYFAWDAAWQVIFLVGVFVVMVYFLGKLSAPFLLKWLKKYGSIEMVTVIAVAMLLGIGELADHFNFSIALGAFLAGSILSQNALAKEIEHAIDPMKNLFTAVFFVTVGMKIDLILLKDYWLSIVLLSVAVLVGKSLTTWLGLFLAGEKSRTALRAALCKAQIGEFSFVIAALGQREGLTEPGVMAIAVGVALGTILFISPVSFNSLKIYDFLATKMPRSLAQFGTFYQSFIVGLKEVLKRSAFISLIKRPVFQIVGYFLLFNGVLILAFLTVNFASTKKELMEYYGYIQYAIWIFAALLCLPFLIAIIRNLEVVLLLITESAFSSKANRFLSRGRLRNILNTTLLSVVVLLLGGVYLTAASPFLPGGFGLYFFLGLVVVLGFLFWSHIIRVNSRLEHMFMDSFSTEVLSVQESKREMVYKEIAKKYPWPVQLHDILIEPNTIACGEQIQDLQLREQTGVSVIGVSRDKYTIYDPSPAMPLFPEDHLFVIGRKEESDKARELLSQKVEDSEVISTRRSEHFKIDKVYISGAAPVVGQTLAESNIRRKYRVNVVGIQRGEKQFTAPTASELIKAEDILVVVGSTRVINKFSESMSA